MPPLKTSIPLPQTKPSMSDLLDSLVLRSSSSQESFHSLNSELTTSIHESSGPIGHDAALRAKGIEIYDAETFLNNPKTIALLEQPTNKSRRKSGQQNTQSNANSPLEPLSLGSKTSYHVSALNTLCQSRGVVPVFEIDGDASNVDFGGILKFGDITIASDERWRSKKEAREALAERGMERAKNLEVKSRQTGTSGALPKDAKNWVGMLHEYHNLISPNLGPTYHDFAIGSSFACTCTVPSLPDHVFGSPTISFASKKAARTKSAREAVEHLISKGLLNEDGSTKSRKKAKLETAVAGLESNNGRLLKVKKTASYAQKCNDASHLLGLQSPQYILFSSSDLAPNMISGHAIFPNDPSMKGEIGEVRHVHGKKKAKELIAMKVWEELSVLAERRGIDIEEVE